MSPRRFLWGLLVFSGLVAAAPAEEGGISVKQLSGPIYLVTDDHYDNTTNSLIYVGQSYVTVIGASWTPDTAKALAGQIRLISHLPIREVIDTSPDPEWAGGNRYWSSIGARVHAIDVTYNLLERTWTTTVAACRKNHPTYPQVPLALPTDRHTGDFDLENGRIRAFYLGPSHTAGDIFVYFPKERVLDAGSILKEQLGNMAKADVAEYPKTLHKLQELHLPIDVVISGHWSAVHGPELIDRYLRLLSRAGGERRTATVPMTWHDPSPHRVQFVSVEKNVQLEVLDWGGAGRSVVLLAASGCTAHEFDDFAPKLTDHYHVYGITRRGFGNSGYVPGELGADLLGNDVLAVIDTLRLSRPVLIGHSFAGAELSNVANRYPARVAGLIYLEAAYPYAFDNGLGMSMAEFQQIMRQPRTPPPTPADLASFGALRSYFERTHGARLPEAELRQEWDTTAEGRVGARRTFPGSGDLIPGVKTYSDIPVPALIIFANPHSLGPWLDNNTDPSVRAAVSAYSSVFEALTRKQENAIRTAVHSARVISLPGANHFVFMSNEADVLREVRTFLAARSDLAQGAHPTARP